MRCFVSALPTMFHSLSYRANDSYHLIHLLFITLLKVLKSILFPLFLCCVLVMVLLLLLLLWLLQVLSHLAKSTNSGFVTIFFASHFMFGRTQFKRCYWSASMCVPCRLRSAGIMGEMRFSCFWDEFRSHQINAVTHKSSHWHLIYIGHYWFRNWSVQPSSLSYWDRNEARAMAH